MPAFVRKKDSFVWLFIRVCCIEGQPTNVHDFFLFFNEIFSDFFRWYSDIFCVCVLPVLFYVHGVMHLPSPSFLLLLCQELGANIPHALLAQPEKYGTVTATVLPDWTGTLMRRLTALIQAASTANSEDFYSFTGPPSVFPYMCLSLWSCIYLCKWDLHVLCTVCVGGKPAGQVPSKSDSTAWLLLSLVAREL